MIRRIRKRKIEETIPHAFEEKSIGEREGEREA